MARDHLLVIDQGTTSTRVIVYDLNLKTKGIGQEEVPLSYPRPGWVEHDPAAIVASWAKSLPLRQNQLNPQPDKTGGKAGSQPL